MPTYRVNADFLVCMSVEVEADSPEQAAAAGAPSAVAELAARLNADPETVRKRISHLQRYGRVVSDEFNDFPSIPCGVDCDLGDTAPRYIAVCDAETGDTLHEEDYR